MMLTPQPRTIWAAERQPLGNNPAAWIISERLDQTNGALLHVVPLASLNEDVEGTPNGRGDAYRVSQSGCNKEREHETLT